MDKSEECIAQLESELRILKSQLQQSQAQLDLVYSQGKTEKERLQSSLNSMLDGTLFHSVRDAHTGELHFDYVSGTWEKIMGVSAEESMADIKNVFANIDPDDLKQLIHNINHSVETKGFAIEVRYHHPVSNNQRWLQITSNPFRAGDQIYADGFIFDITMKKETEESLASEHRRLKALSNMPDGALYRTVRDMKTGILRFEHVYGKWEEITGVTVEETLADIRNVFGRIEPTDLKNLMQEIEASLNPLRSFEKECRYFYPQRPGEYWILISSHPRYEGEDIVADGFIFDITARKIVEKKLKAEKERLETLGDHIPDGVLFRFEIDRHTKNMSLAYASGTWEKITGVPANVAISDINSMFATIHPDDVPVIMQEIDKCVQSLTTLLCEYRIVKNGQTRWMQITSYPREEGDLIVADGIIIDITRHKEAEQELKAEKNRLQTIGDNLPGGALFQFSRDTRTAQMRVSYTGATWSNVTGISSDDARTNILSIFDAIPSDALPEMIQSIEDSARTMNDFNIEVHTTKRWLHIVARPRREGNFIVWDGIITNITDRKKIEHELETEKIRLQNLGDNIPAGSLYQFVRDTRTRQIRMSYVSASWENVTGISAETVLNNVLKMFSKMPRDEYEVFMKAIDESEHTMSDFRQETLSDNRWLRWISRPRREESMIVWDGIIMNITAQKAAEAELTKYREELEVLVQERTDELTAANEELFATNEEMTAVNEELFATNEELTALNEEIEVTNEELKRYQTELEKMVDERTKELVYAKEKAEESDRLKSSFLANMSHEIRTPLNGIVGFLQFIDSDDLSPDRRHEYANIIKNSSTQLTKIIDDIIDVSKIEARLMNINPIPVYLNELMNEMHMFFETFLQSKNKGDIELILDNNGFIDNCLIYIDAVRLRQVITNLIGNAVKFTDKGYIYFTYHQSAPDMLEFVVEDSGIGLPESQKDIIFERFRQAEVGNNRQYGGTGLGLTISRSLVQMKGGNMWVKSTVGFGSSFYFTVSYLPVAPEDEIIFTGTSTERSSLDKPFAGKTILLVEPVLLKYMYYEKLISTTGATVIKAESLDEWSDHLAKTGHFDLVIADGRLFDNENTDRISQIKDARANLPIALVVSGEKQLACQNLCNAIIEQPVDYAKILKILEEFMR